MHLKPHNLVLAGSDHDDYPFDHMPMRPRPPGEYYENVTKIVEASNVRQYTDIRRETGISKPSIFTGLPSSRINRIPICFAPDIMHLISLNVTDLLLDLWRGKIPVWALDNKATWDWAVLQGDTWEEHGKSVAGATPYIPGSFDRPPCNPAERSPAATKPGNS